MVHVSDKNLKDISEKLDYLREYNIKDEQWNKFGEFLYKLRIGGVNLPYADALIAFIAIQNYLCVYTKDKHFKLIQIIEPSLKIYEG